MTEDPTHFITDFIELINSDLGAKEKLTAGLRVLCTRFGYDKGFAYQTDGFHFFHLMECYGNQDKSLLRRLEISRIREEQAAQLGEKVFLYARRGGGSPAQAALLDMVGADRMLLYPARDKDHVTVGWIGLAGKGDPEVTDEEIRITQLLAGLMARELTVREHKARTKRAKKTLESIMNNMGVDIYVNSFDTHEMLYANRSMAAPYGGWKHFEGKKCYNALYTDKTGECEFCPKKNIIDQNGRPTKVYSWDYQRPFDGSWFRVFSAAFEWIDGQMAHVITSVDITHQKNIEQQLVEAKEKAERLDRQKSAFLANMGHEIRTPINAIVGFSELIPQTEDPAEREVFGNIVRQNSDLLMQLVADILDLSKIEAGMLHFEKESLDTQPLCEQIALSYKVRGTEVPVVAAPDGSHTITSDRKRLTQVLTNFVNNALKFTTQGQITVGTLPPENGMIEFFVQDTGTGIAPEKLAEVFDRFVKLNDKVSGTGLGLSICKSIVEQLGGQIGVESELGKGSRFWFRHPI